MASAQLYLDTRRSKSDKTFPVKIRIGYGRKAKLFTTIISLSLEDFKKLLNNRSKSIDKLKDAKLKLGLTLRRANQIIDDLNPFDIDLFTIRFHQKGNRLDLLYLLSTKAELLRQTEKIGNSNLYKQACALILEYHKQVSQSEELLINTVNVKWLQNFESWVFKQVKLVNGNITCKYSTTTLGMYLTRVRSIFNDAISEQLLSSNQYPFHTPQNNRGYKIPKSSGNKRSLSNVEIRRLFDYLPVNKQESFAKDVFLFSYLASGMNCIDIFLLKWNSIDGNKFSFIRKKTQGKVGGQNKITIPLSLELKNIIARQGSEKLDGDYIFNVVPQTANEVDMQKAVRSAITTINQSLKKIAKKLEITTDISTYFARHSFSTNQMNNEVPLAFISKQLGHSSLKTTENYLSDFTSDKAELYLSKLLGDQD